MKFVIDRLKKGETVEAQIIELLNDSEYIVSFGGDLIRVANASERALKSGQVVRLKVVSVQPLSFQFAGAQTGYSVSV